tara:strand:- start:134 stop:250 length:117 start_codon:yes stop_codon:yes gene_type:complete
MAEKGDLRKRKEAKEKEYIKSLYKFINNNIYIKYFIYK